MITYNSENKEVTKPENYDQFYYGHGKLLLTGEYLILDGAKGLALPTKFGQSMGVRYTQSFSPKLTWKSFDHNGNLWFESHFEFWQFKCIDNEVSEEAKILSKILKEARKQNKHFLRDEQDVYVETRLGFPLDWGLGSSSTLFHNIAKWAYVSPFELLFNVFDGSGYDIACAQSDGPITYEKNVSGPKWSPVSYNPTYKDNMYFVYLGEKQKSEKGVSYYRSLGRPERRVIAKIDDLTDQLIKEETLEGAMDITREHESMMSDVLKMDSIKESRFNDFGGAIKSLGAWGGDFILVYSSKGDGYVKDYFQKRGLETVFKYEDMVLSTPRVMPNVEGNHQVH